MAYAVEWEHRTVVVQGLPSPVRARLGRPRIPAGEGVPLGLKVGVWFDEEQLTDKGWFVDTDEVADVVRECADGLSGRRWTEMFDFRPTFELVARHLFDQLAVRIALSLIHI